MILPSDLVEICKDNGDSVWKYSPGDNVYYRIYEKTKEVGLISGKYIPDPEILLAKKLRIHAVRGERVNIEALKSTPAVYALWEHQKKQVELSSKTE